MKMLHSNLTIFFFLLFSNSLLAQNTEVSYTVIDTRTDSILYADEGIEAFAQKLCAPYNTDREKARAIYSWITQKVRYDCRKYLSKRKGFSITYTSLEDYESKLKVFRQKQALKTLKAKRGICDDYSNLFAHLARAVDLEVEVITGLTKAGIGKRLRGTSHAWNAVKIDGTWQLVDVTWGSGYVKEGCRGFIRKFKDKYFLIPPQQLQYTHFPDEAQWFLLATPSMDKKDFVNAPDISYGFHLLGVEQFAPNTGKIRLNNKTIIIQLTVTNLSEIGKVYVTEDNLIRSIPYKIEDNQLIINYSKKKSCKSLGIWIEINNKKEEVITYKL